MKNNLYLLSILLFFSIISCQRTVQTTYYIVRHGEKMDNSSNPALSEAGQQRAQELKKLLADKHISQVYSTNYLRTSNTAKPLADAINVPVQTYDPKNQKAFIEDLKKIEGKNVLVVGHSNTITAIANGLYEKDTLQKELPEDDFDNLFIVKRQSLPSKKLQLTAKIYGKVTP